MVKVGESNTSAIASGGYTNCKHVQMQNNGMELAWTEVANISTARNGQLQELEHQHALLFGGQPNHQNN